MCSDVCNAPLSRRTMGTPVYIARNAGKRHLLWQPFVIYEPHSGYMCNIYLFSSRPSWIRDSLHARSIEQCCLPAFTLHSPFLDFT